MKKRLAIIRNELGLTQREFAEALSFKTNTIGKLECGSSPISGQFITRLVAVFPQINREYLETGVGEPLKPESPASEPVDGLESAKAFLLDLFRSLPPDKQSTLAELAKAIVEERPAPSPGEKKA